jgi:hypothetical protein
MRKDVREFIRRLEAVGLTVEPTPGHYRVLRDGKPLRKANGMPFTLPFSPDTIRWRRAAIVELRKLGHQRVTPSKKRRSPPTFRSPGFDTDTFSPAPCACQATAVAGTTVTAHTVAGTPLRECTTRWLLLGQTRSICTGCPWAPVVTPSA